MAYSDYYSTNMNDAATGGLLAAFGYKFVAKTHRLAYGMKATYVYT